MFNWKKSKCHTKKERVIHFIIAAGHHRNLAEYGSWGESILAICPYYFKFDIYREDSCMPALAWYLWPLHVYAQIHTHVCIYECVCGRYIKYVFSFYYLKMLGYNLFVGIIYTLIHHKWNAFIQNHHTRTHTHKCIPACLLWGEGGKRWVKCRRGSDLIRFVMLQKSQRFAKVIKR